MTIFPGFILSKISEWARKDRSDCDKITIDNRQANGEYCIHQARLRLAGDPTVYRLIIAPANAPIFINDDKRPIADAFPKPLGDN